MESDIYWPGTTAKVADTVWSAKLGVITKTKKGSNAMLVQIDQNTATVTPFGSLGIARHRANANAGEQSFGRRPNAIRLAWCWIRHLFTAA